jgi:ribonuclease P protein component
LTFAKKGVKESDAKENLSTEQSPPRQETRFSGANGDQKRACRAGASSGKRAQTLDAASLLKKENVCFNFPKSNRLRKPAEFQRVYKNGKRFDAALFSIFVLQNDFSNHRLGITASRKSIGKAVSRNRAKRLLREAFRLSKLELNNLKKKYDFVINARRNLLKIKMPAALEDFQKIIKQIAERESK